MPESQDSQMVDGVTDAPKLTPAREGYGSSTMTVILEDSIPARRTINELSQASDIVVIPKESSNIPGQSNVNDMARRFDTPHSSEPYRPAVEVRTGISAATKSISTSGSYQTARSQSSTSALAEKPIHHVRRTIEESQDNGSESQSRRHSLLFDYKTALQEKGLILPKKEEIDWSGKGQHVEYATREMVPLKVLGYLGSSLSATVDKVLCRRIALARKTMRCTRTWNIKEALGEVEHLHKLRHSHIVQLVGSYLQGNKFAILMYPAADCHLGTFLEDTADMRVEKKEFTAYTFELGMRKDFLKTTFGCLSDAIAYIHSQTTKHMDIKPANILVRKLRSPYSEEVWRVYISDFGFSRSFSDQDHSQTDGPTARTPKYCAPEVYAWESRGRSADIFSLGCVFLEIFTVLRNSSVQEFADFRQERSGEEAFRANIEGIPEWINTCLKGEPEDSSPEPDGMQELMLRMISSEPAKRPVSQDLLSFFSSVQDSDFARQRCCCSVLELYEAYRP